MLGLSAVISSRADHEISKLGTNLLTVANGQTLSGDTAELPVAAPGMISRIEPVTAVDDIGSVSNVNAYRSPLIPSINTNALSVQATSLGLPDTVGTSVAQGRFLNAATAREPVAVLGAAAAGRMGIDRIYPGERIWVGGQWFYLAGILNPAVLAPEIDTSVLIGYPAAQKYLGFDGHPSEIYLRAQTEKVNAVHDVLAATANPEQPNQVDVAQPSDALVAQADAEAAMNSLFLGLGAVSLLVGAVGVANIMLIGVLERRSEIGLRRSLGATKGQIRTQFLAEAILLASSAAPPALPLAPSPPSSTPTSNTGPPSSPRQPGPAASPPQSSSAPSPASSPPSAPHDSHQPKHSEPCRCCRSPSLQASGATAPAPAPGW